jgi:16S rRNA (cytosine1402-N4)-methyltransferase
MQGVEMAREVHVGAEGEPPPVHAPVLPREVLAVFAGEDAAAPGAQEAPSLEGWIVDATVGAGGHAQLLLEAFPHVRVLGLDQDPQILSLAAQRLERFGDRVQLERGRLSTLAAQLARRSARPLVGMLFDLGVSSLQLDRPERGFSFRADGPLDMRMDPDRERTAADIINHWDEEDLADLFFHEGGEPRARRLARVIVDARRRAPFLRTGALAALIERTVGSRGGAHSRLHPATRVFQALRRAVNEESEELLAGLAAAEQALDHGGRLAVISFHSGEDGAVKRFLVRGVRAGDWRHVHKKPLTAGREEIRANPRARSASLRAAVRLRDTAAAATETHG